MRNIPAELAEHYVEQGYWTGETLGEMLAAGIKAAPDAQFTVHSQVHPYGGSFADVELLARRLAAGLLRRGVGPGDVVAFQLPNWVEAAATFWATAFLGAVVVPIVHFYGRKELTHIFGDAKPTAFITATSFGRMEFDPEVAAGVPIVGVVGDGFEALLDDLPLEGTLPADPNAPALIAYTSGTTSAPKGVIHSHQTLGHEVRQLAHQSSGDTGKQLTATPVGHFIGMVGAFLIPVLRGTSVNLADVWDPGKALELMDSDGLAIGGGPPYFMTSLLDHPDFGPQHLRHIRTVGLGGSSVPVAVTRRLADLGITVFRSYGSTEHPSVTGSQHDAPEDKRLYTDGCPLSGVEVRLGPDGEIFSRGPDLCMGYTDDALTAKAFDDDGWYRTGDVGVLDDDGYLTITDRISDIIIRGGENISAVEVEDVLLGLPGVAEVAVVAFADDRLGERAAAVFRLLPGSRLPTLVDIQAHCQVSGLARQKWPERVHELGEFPRTASGKIQKYVVRSDLARRDIAVTG